MAVACHLWQKQFFAITNFHFIITRTSPRFPLTYQKIYSLWTKELIPSHFCIHTPVFNSSLCLRGSLSEQFTALAVHHVNVVYKNIQTSLSLCTRISHAWWGTCFRFRFTLLYFPSKNNDVSAMGNENRSYRHVCHSSCQLANLTGRRIYSSHGKQLWIIRIYDTKR